MKVIRNTYPVRPKVPHAEPGDVVQWQHFGGRKNLVRLSDQAIVFSRDLLSPGQHDGDRPIVGVVAYTRSEGWFLELGE
jgi:hypothetical protein